MNETERERWPAAAKMNHQPPETAELPPLLTIPEVAKLLRINRVTVYRLVRNDELRMSKIGSRSLVTREEVARFLGTLAEGGIASTSPRVA